MSAAPGWAGSAAASRAVEGIASLRAARREARALQIHTIEAGRNALLRVCGPVDVVTTPVLGEALQPWRRPGQRLILDLRSVDYIESPGLRLLIALGDELQPSGGQIRLVVEPGGRVERTLGLVGLNQRFPIFHSARAAWAGRNGAVEDRVGGIA